MKSIGLVLLLAFATACPCFASAQPRTATGVIAALRGDVYTATEEGRTTIFIVTSDGIVVVDPLNALFARWLANELNARFPGRPVRYVVYSMLDFDRLGGAGAFPGRPDIVAHQTIVRTIQASRRTFPARLKGYDYNVNGLLELEELTAANNPDMLGRLDRNADGHLSPEEAWSETSAATRSFVTRFVITLGGKSIELVYLGPESTGATVVYVSGDRIAFAATVPSLTDPFADRALSTSEVTAWVSALGDRQFDQLLLGNGQNVPRAQIAALYDYVQALVAAVASGIQNGRTIRELQRDPAIDSFAGTPFATTRDADLATLYQRTKVIAIDGYGTSLENYVSMKSSRCPQGYICTYGTRMGVAGGGGVGLSIRQWRAAVEVTSGIQLATSMVTSTIGERENSRESHVSILGGYRTAPPGRFNVAALTGVTFVSTRAAVNRVFIGSPRQSGTFTISKTAWTIGVDIAAPVGRRIGVVFPIRATTAPEGLPRSGVDVRAGVGVDIALMRRVL